MTLELITLAVSCLSFNVMSFHPQDATNDFIIEKNVEIVSRLPPLNTMSIDIGELEAGKKGSVTLTLSNNTASSFKISRIWVGCNCVDVKCFGDTIAPGGSVKANVAFAVPAKGTVRNSVQVIKFIENEESVIQLGINYELTGVANFAVAEVSPKALTGAKECDFRIPLFISRPVKATDILISGTGELKDIKCDILLDGDRYVARCKMPLKTVGEFALAGELKLEVPSRGTEHSIPCFIGRQSDIILMPSVVRFVLRDKYWTSEVTIRDNRDPSSHKDDLSIACQGDGDVKVTVDHTRVKNLYRLKLSIPAELKSKITVVPNRLNWQVSWSGGISEFNSRSIRVD